MAKNRQPSVLSFLHMSEDRSLSRLGREDCHVVSDRSKSKVKSGVYVLDECRSNDDSSPEVSSEEVDIDIDPDPADTCSDDGKERGSGRHNEDHKES